MMASAGRSWATGGAWSGVLGPCLWLCHQCPDRAEPGATGHREVVCVGLRELFWAILVYCKPSSRRSSRAAWALASRRKDLAASSRLR